jgi:hypothetical protein
MNLKRLALAGAGALSLLAGPLVGPAGAATSSDTLQEHTYTCDFAGTGDCVKATDGAYGRWVTFPKNGDDSPSDSNSKALQVHTPGTSSSAQDYTEVYSNHSLHINTLAANVKNISFDAYKPALQGGSPRIDVFFSNPLSDGGTYAAIDAGNCQQTLSATWVRADATGRTSAGCTIYSSNGTPYTSDGTQSAWAALLAANPGIKVAYTFMVFDEPSGNTGVDYRVDRLALGTKTVYNASNTPVACTTEAAC